MKVTQQQQPRRESTVVSPPDDNDLCSLSTIESSDSFLIMDKLNDDENETAERDERDGLRRCTVELLPSMIQEASSDNMKQQLERYWCNHATSPGSCSFIFDLLKEGLCGFTCPTSGMLFTLDYNLPSNILVPTTTEKQNQKSFRTFQVRASVCRMEEASDCLAAKLEELKKTMNDNNKALYVSDKGDLVLAKLGLNATLLQQDHFQDFACMLEDFMEQAERFRTVLVSSHNNGTNKEKQHQEQQSQSSKRRRGGR
eukprot:CAMPEP_0194027332 /NCGR_PEP_ID=MMETSP0009_2-20130614/1495_1 /TAXON_ID=210454 /ORGANISM="Grammatophora oceanica, Strain CCMP 410" /LENGTH=255 /DNA_ID=CAMNT_0038666361 /DNA_START=391 /DNA_END=1155 /DNA_ORIENTATION=+